MLIKIIDLVSHCYFTGGGVCLLGRAEYPHAPLCVPSMGSSGVFGYGGSTITSIAEQSTHMLHCVFPVWGLQGSLDMKGRLLHQLLKR